MLRVRFTIRLESGIEDKKMSELLDQLSQEITQAKSLPLDQQPAAFEVIREKLEAMIADSRPQETE